jgi:PelA/Pel-15E family pectate lyase
VIEAVDAAVSWFRAVPLTGMRQEMIDDPKAPTGKDKVVVDNPDAPPLWARFYEIGTNRPLYADRDGTIHTRLADLSHERRNGYGWLGTWPQNLLERDHPLWKRRLADR